MGNEERKEKPTKVNIFGIFQYGWLCDNMSVVQKLGTQSVHLQQHLQKNRGTKFRKEKYGTWHEDSKTNVYQEHFPRREAAFPACDQQTRLPKLMDAPQRYRLLYRSTQDWNPALSSGSKVTFARRDARRGGAVGLHVIWQCFRRITKQTATELKAVHKYKWGQKWSPARLLEIHLEADLTLFCISPSEDLNYVVEFELEVKAAERQPSGRTVGNRSRRRTTCGSPKKKPLWEAPLGKKESVAQKKPHTFISNICMYG